MSKLEIINDVHYTKVPVHDNDKEKENAELPLKYGYGVRHVQLVIFFFCLSTSFIARGHLGVTLVAMTSPSNTVTTQTYIKDNKTYFNKANELNETNYNYLNETAAIVNYTSNPGGVNSSEHWTIYRTYDWPKPIQEMVLTAFFFGYCLMMFPIALVCQRWGGKVPLQISMLFNGIVSIMTPHLTLWGGWKAVCVCRMIQGLSQSGTFPGTQTLLAQWVPANERATLSGYVYSGTVFGNIIGFQVSGVIADAWGWPAVFWAVGLMCLLMFVLLTIFGSASPRYHTKISEEEKNYIMRHCDSGAVQKKRAPWKAIISSKAVWGTIATHVGSGVSFVFFLTQVPSYIHYILGIDVKISGLLSSLPYVVSWFTSLTFGVVSDYLTNNNIVSIKNARRIFNTISQVGVAGSLICASYATSTAAAIVCFVTSMSLQMALHSGWMVNYIDLSPTYSGTLVALGNTMTNICVTLMPVLVSNIVTDMTNVYQWRIMMYIVAAIAFVPNLIFVTLISVDVQPWNDGGFVDSEKVTEVKLEDIKNKDAENSK